MRPYTQEEIDDMMFDPQECPECHGEGGWASCREDCCPHEGGEEMCLDPACWRRCPGCKGKGYYETAALCIKRTKKGGGDVGPGR